MLASAIPVLTKTVINFEVYEYTAQQERVDQQGRTIVRNVPQVQARGAMVTIDSLIGDANVGFRSLGFEEYAWGEQPTDPVAGVHNGLSSWDAIIGTATGAAVVAAGQAAILNLIRTSIPSFSAPLNPGTEVPLAVRLQRIETNLRWDDPSLNQVAAYVQFGTDETFTRKLATVPFVFMPDSLITRQYLPQQPEESADAYAARLVAFRAENGISQLSDLLDNDDFKSLAEQIHNLVFTELKAKAVRYPNIDLASIGQGFLNCYPVLQMAAGSAAPTTTTAAPTTTTAAPSTTTAAPSTTTAAP